MVVRIRLRKGPPVTRKRGKNRHLALACGALLIPASLMAYVLGFWRLASDMGMAREFAIKVPSLIGSCGWPPPLPCTSFLPFSIAMGVAGRCVCRECSCRNSCPFTLGKTPILPKPQVARLIAPLRHQLLVS